MGIGFPGLFAGLKETEGHERYEGNLLCEQRRNHHGLPSNGIGRQIANAHGGAADPYESMESRPSRASGRAGHRAKGSRHPGGAKESRSAICWQNVTQSSGRENERMFSRVGTPDASRGACPVWGGLGGIPLLKGNMDAVLLLHR